MGEAAKYAALHREFFGVEPRPPSNWIHFPFDWPSPQAQELMSTIWKVESRLWRDYVAAIAAEQIPGCIVEFGVSEGASFVQMVQFRNEVGLRREIFGFDSFEGLPKPGAADADFWQEGQFFADYEKTRSFVNPENDPSVFLVKGWFYETLANPAISQRIKQIAFARIDCDLYQSAVECLEFVRDRLVDGAFLRFDDWTDDPQTGETRAFFEFAERVRGELSFNALCRIALGGMHMRARRHEARRDGA